MGFIFAVVFAVAAWNFDSINAAGKDITSEIAQNFDIYKGKEEAYRDITSRRAENWSNKARTVLSLAAARSSTQIPAERKTKKRKKNDKKPISEQVTNQRIEDYLYESDIVLTPQQADAIDEIGSNRRKRKILSTDTFGSRALWGTTINYVLDSRLGSTKERVIRDGINFWQSETCLTFRARSSGDRIKFISGSGCYSSVGRVGGQQSISIGNGCEYFGIVTHEIGHALGFFHEQSRFDRDSHIQVNNRNIRSGYEGNFNKYPERYMDTFELPYDLGSVMHYAPYSFARSSSPVILTIDELYQETIGNRHRPSFIDVFQVNQAYCSGVCGNLACANGGYADPTDCTKCKCPEGFGGRLCTARQSGENANCGADLTAEANRWRTLSYRQRRPSVAPVGCHWHIRAPEGQRVEVQFESGGDLTCSTGCWYDFVELKLASNFQRVGYRWCCEIPTNVLTAETNLAIVIAHTHRRNSFSLKYRYTTGSGGGTPNPGATTSRTTTTTESLAEQCAGEYEWNKWSKCTRKCGFCGTRRRRAKECKGCTRRAPCFKNCVCSGPDRETEACGDDRPCGRDYTECCDGYTLVEGREPKKNECEAD